MARIRTIKPDFFRHRKLYLLERDTQLPLRVAFAGLWTVADREGRFRWEPDEIKLDCLPYDEVDFSRVLDALASRGFVVKYAVGGREYGFIPGFTEHQVINNREQASKLPAPPEQTDNVIELTRETRVIDASSSRHDPAQAEGKGKEGKGREDASLTRSYAFEGRVVRLTPEDFARWQKSFPHLGDVLAGVLEGRDAWLAEQPPDVQKKWFQSTSAWLANKNTDAAARAKDRPRERKPKALEHGSPEWLAREREAGAL